MIRLHIPRAFSVGTLAVGLGWLAVGLSGLSRRVSALVEGVPPGDPLGSPIQLGFTATGVLVALLMVLLGVRWLAVLVEVGGAGEAGVRVRTWRGSVRVPLEEVRGLVLRSNGGAPQLRVVLRDGRVRSVPAWALRATHEDGEVEPAGPALLTAGLPVPVKVLTLTGEHRPPG